MPEVLTRILKRLVVLTLSLDWLAPLLLRLFFGYFWVETGWGKIHNLDTFAQRFADWGIPHPYLNAILSGYTEFIGGVLLMLGLLTRLATLPMMFNMLVAILTVKLKKVAGLNDFVEMDEALYIFIFFWLFMNGPGRASIDYLIQRWMGIESVREEAATRMPGNQRATTS